MHDRQDSMKIIVEDSAEQATAMASQLFKTIVCESIAESDCCHLALAGGTTPHALYQELATSSVSGEMPWGGVQVFFGDERDVPQDHVESNYRMVQRTLLDHIPVPPSHIHPMLADSPDISAAAAEYEQHIRQAVPSQPDGLPQFDLILLGMGGDGHTASLFPDTEALHETEKLVTAYFVPALGRNRMTFTFPLINAAKNVTLLVTGEDKANAVAVLLGDDPSAKENLPAAHIAPAGLFMLVLDAAAAKRAGLKTK